MTPSPWVAVVLVITLFFGVRIGRAVFSMRSSTRELNNLARQTTHETEERASKPTPVPPRVAERTIIIQEREESG